jgi:hypothetical protein
VVLSRPGFVHISTGSHGSLTQPFPLFTSRTTCRHHALHHENGGSNVPRNSGMLLL